MFRNVDEAMRALDAADKAGADDDARDIALIIRQMESASKPSTAQVEPEIDYQQQMIDEMSPGEKFLVGVGKGMSDTYEGITQLGLEAGEALGFADEGSADAYGAEKTRDRKYYRKLEDDSPFLTGAGSLVGNVASIPIPGAGATGNVLARGAKAALAGGALAGTQFVEGGDSRLQNVALGAGFGGAAQLGLDQIGKVGRKMINGKAGLYKSDDTAQLIAEGKKRGVSVMFDDISDSPMAKKISIAAENAGALGTASKRLKQQEEAASAAKSYADSLLDDMGGGDFIEQIQGGLSRKLGTLKKIANKKYTEANAAMDQFGEVPIDKFRAVLDEGIAKEGGMGSIADEGLVKLLNQYKEANPGKFTDTTEIRKRLSGVISDFYKGKNTTIGQPGVDLLQAAKGALDDDMARFAQSTDEVSFNKWKNANNFYQERIAKPFKETNLKSLVKTEEPERAYKWLVATGGLNSRTKNVYKSLDNKGRAAVRYGLVKDALDAATAENRPFSPARFAGMIEKRMTVADEFFKGAEKKELLGMAKLMRHIERSGQVAENPPNGSRLIPILMAFGTSVEPVSMTAGAVSALGVKTMFQSERGRTLLLAASNHTPKTKAFDEVVGRMNTFLSRASASSAVDD